MRRERLRYLRPGVRHVEQTDPNRDLRVEEHNDDGKANVRFRLGAGQSALEIPLSADVKMDILNTGENADGHLLVRHADSGWTAHVVECKKQINGIKKWKKVQGQLRAGMVRLQMVADFLGISIAHWRCHVAFRADQFSTGTTPNMATLELAVGVPRPTESVLEHRERRTWEQGRLDDAPFVGVVVIQKIALDGDGNGSGDLGDPG